MAMRFEEEKTVIGPKRFPVLDLTSCAKWFPKSSIFVESLTTSWRGGITCGAIDEPRKSSKAIDERVIINFCDKNVVIARFCDKNVVIARFS